MAESLTHEWTDDAFLDANVISIAPKVAGQVKRVHVKNNQAVKDGDLLLELDPRDLAVQLEQKRAAVESARANVVLLRAVVELSRTQVATAEATAEKARADLKRAEELIQNHTISEDLKLSGPAFSQFKPGDSVVIAEVQDTGTGIAEAFLPKILDPFFTTKPAGIGTGLGLSVVNKIVDLQEGQSTSKTCQREECE